MITREDGPPSSGVIAYSLFAPSKAQSTGTTTRKSTRSTKTTPDAMPSFSKAPWLCMNLDFGVRCDGYEPTSASGAGLLYFSNNGLGQSLISILCCVILASLFGFDDAHCSITSASPTWRFPLRFSLCCSHH
ncbi:none [Leptomonas seymouri]|uniref:None n=1 Tax=Leptomonas seymouri TaxID=5684 RepID=A0A0N1PBP6_LEPSE|nr:none [Leptomonas seymouri]|eukprot:KPI83935.1 none [Leptomonas seymouri]